MLTKLFSIKITTTTTTTINENKIKFNSFKNDLKDKEHHKHHHHYQQQQQQQLSEIKEDDLTDRCTEASENSIDDIYIPKMFKCLNCGCTFFISQSTIEVNHSFCGKDCTTSYSLFHILPTPIQKFGPVNAAANF